MFESILSGLAGEFRLLVIIAICAALGVGGYFIRTGIGRKSRLNEIKAKAIAQGHTVNQKWYELERGANQRIWIPIVLWLLFYGFMYLAYPGSFPGALLLLIFPVLGFFGVVIFPDD